MIKSLIASWMQTHLGIHLKEPECPVCSRHNTKTDVVQTDDSEEHGFGYIEYDQTLTYGDGISDREKDWDEQMDKMFSDLESKVSTSTTEPTLVVDDEI